jgi:hypothetical protein
MATTEDPWDGLRRPASTVTANARPVGGDARWGFYWMLDFDGHRLLGLRHPKGFTTAELPNLKGVSVEIATDSEDVDILLFKLLDSAHKEIFFRLCSDIIASTAAAVDERQAVAAAINRTWRWHHLLKGGPDQRLSEEEQKGLIGELRALTNHVAAAFPLTDALQMWTGPFGAPKDFEIGRVALEAKAHRGAAQPSIAVSSEFQFEMADFEHLFLYVINLARPTPTDDGFSLSDVVDEVRLHVERADASAVDALDVRLMAAGYRSEEDYSDSLWMETGSQFYEVRDSFPRLTTSDILPGVQRVRYEIALPDCRPFAVADSAFAIAIRNEGTATP